MAWITGVYADWLAKPETSKSSSDLMPMSRSAPRLTKDESRADLESLPNTYTP